MLGLFSGESSFGEIVFFYAEQIVASSLDFLQSLWHTCFFGGPTFLMVDFYNKISPLKVRVPKILSQIKTEMRHGPRVVGH